MANISTEKLFSLLQQALKKFNFETVYLEEGWLYHEDSDFILAPEFIFAENDNDNGRTSTGTIIHIYHHQLFAEPIFEYQYSWGDSADEALITGFEWWIQSDWLLLLDVLKTNEHDFMTMQMEFDIEETGTKQKREIIFGNVAHYGGKQTQSASNNSDNDVEDEHDFCPCCLFTNSVEAFQPLLQSNDTFAIRLFASYDADTQTADADCRINGEEFDQAKPLLCDYAKTWGSEDIEFRKQYIIIKSIND